MGRRVLVLLLLAITVVEALVTGKTIFYRLAYSLLGIFGISYLWAWANLRWVDLERATISAYGQVGKVAEERFLVRNHGALPKLWLEIEDHSELPGHYASMVVSGLKPGQQRGWSVRTLCQRRGRFRLGPLSLVSSDPFGLFMRRREVHGTSSIVVFPLTAELPRFATLISEHSGGDTVHQRTHHVTSNVAGVREYYPGDAYKRIHWPSTARTGRLIVKEFELDPTADVWLFVDMHAAVQAYKPLPEEAVAHGDLPVLPARRAKTLDPSTEEYVVAAAASLAKHFLDRNRAVGLLAHSQHREMVQPEMGERQLAKILETLAVIRAQGEVTMAQLLSSEGASFGRNSMAVVVTPSTETTWVEALRDLGRRGVHGAAVVVDPASFGSTRPAEPVLHALAATEIPAYRVREGDSLAASLAAPALPAVD